MRLHPAISYEITPPARNRQEIIAAHPSYSSVPSSSEPSSPKGSSPEDSSSPGMPSESGEYSADRQVSNGSALTASKVRTLSTTSLVPVPDHTPRHKLKVAHNFAGDACNEV